MENKIFKIELKDKGDRFKSAAYIHFTNLGYSLIKIIEPSIAKYIIVNSERKTLMFIDFDLPLIPDYVLAADGTLFEQQEIHFPKL